MGKWLIVSRRSRYAKGIPIGPYVTVWDTEEEARKYTPDQTTLTGEGTQTLLCEVKDVYQEGKWSE